MEHVELKKVTMGAVGRSKNLSPSFDLFIHASTCSIKVCFSLAGSPLPWPVSRTQIRHTFCLAFGSHGRTSGSLPQLLQTKHERHSVALKADQATNSNGLRWEERPFRPNEAYGADDASHLTFSKFKISLASAQTQLSHLCSLRKQFTAFDRKK